MSSALSLSPELISFWVLALFGSLEQDLKKKSSKSSWILFKFLDKFITVSSALAVSAKSDLFLDLDIFFLALLISPSLVMLAGALLKNSLFHNKLQIILGDEGNWKVSNLESLTYIWYNPGASCITFLEMQMFSISISICRMNGQNSIAWSPCPLLSPLSETLLPGSDTFLCWS